MLRPVMAASLICGAIGGRHHHPPTPHQTDIHTDPDDPQAAHVFSQGFGTGFSWLLGYVGMDTATISGKHFDGAYMGFAQMGSVNIGNIYPDAGGYSSDDGILGMRPGCLYKNADSKCETFQDLLSVMAASGGIAERTHVTCWNKDQTAGKLFMGRVTSDPGAGSAQPIPLKPFWDPATKAGTGAYYTPAKLSDGETVTFTVGGKTLGAYNATKYNALVDDHKVLLDTGTDGFGMPDDLFEVVFEAIFTAWAASDQARAAIAATSGVTVDDVTIEFLAENGYDVLRGDGLMMSPEQAATLSSLVPDVVTDWGEGKALTVSGRSFLYETTPCSGVYKASWYLYDELAFGNALNVGRSILLNTADLINPFVQDYGEAGDCSDAGLGEVAAELTGYPGLAQAAGTILAHISLGTPPQKFELQLDSGSQQLILYASGCMMLGLTSCQGTSSFCDSCIQAAASGGPAWAVPGFGTRNGFVAKGQLLTFPASTDESRYPSGHTPNFGGADSVDRGLKPSECGTYFEPAFSSLNAACAVNNFNGSAWDPSKGLSEFNLYAPNCKGYSRDNMQVTDLFGFHPSQLMEALSKVKPYASCARSRDECGVRNVFEAESSSTFQSMPKGSSYRKYTFPEAEPWAPENPIVCDACASPQPPPSSPSHDTTPSPGPAPPSPGRAPPPHSLPPGAHCETASDCASGKATTKVDRSRMLLFSSHVKICICL